MVVIAITIIEVLLKVNRFFDIFVNKNPPPFFRGRTGYMDVQTMRLQFITRRQILQLQPLQQTCAKYRL